MKKEKEEEGVPHESDLEKVRRDVGKEVGGIEGGREELAAPPLTKKVTVEGPLGEVHRAVFLLLGAFGLPVTPRAVV